jgi:MFS family permease
MLAAGARPQRKGASLASSQPSLREVFLTLWANTTFRHLLICYSIICFFTYGIMLWQPAFFIRSYGLKTGEVGTWFAVIYGLGGMLGTYLGGELASRHAANNERLQLRAISIVVVGFGVLSVLIYLSPNRYGAFGLLGVASVGAYMTNGPLFATIQTLVPPRMRALSIALLYFFSNLIGMGLGPLTAGALSDAFRSWAGEESLRYALLALCPGYFWAGWHLWQASRSVSRDLEKVQADRDSAAEDGNVSVNATTRASIA